MIESHENSPTELPIDMTLRLRSDSVSFGPLAEQMAMPTEHLHVLGEPMATEGRLAGRISRQHYLCTVGVRSATDEDVNIWVKMVLDLVESQPRLLDHLKTGQVYGELWIARLHGSPDTPMPAIDVTNLARASKIGLGILLENYTSFDDTGAPKKNC